MKILDVFKPSDPELVEKTLARLSEQDTWNDVFSTKLIALLDNIDRLKSELRQSSRRTEDRGIEATRQFLEAKACLQLSQEDLNQARVCTTAAQEAFVQALAAATGARTQYERTILRFKVAMFQAVIAAAFSWTGAIWAVWISLRAFAPVWVPLGFTVLVSVVTIFLCKKVHHEG